MRISRVIAAIATIAALLFGFAVPAQAATARTITVTLKGTHGTLPAGCLTATSSAKTVKDCTPTSAGVFQFTGLPVATYRVTTSGFATYIPTSFTVDSSKLKSSNFTTTKAIKRKGRIVGTVMSAAGAPLPGVTVHVSATPDTGTPAVSLDAVTDTEGAFTAYLPRTGSYDLTSGTVDGFGTDYGRQWWWQDAYLVEDDSTVTASIVRVPSGAVTGMLTAPPTITASTVCASLHDRATGALRGSACGSRGAAFTIPNVNPGSYFVCVSGNSAPANCNDAAASGTAEKVGSDVGGFYEGKPGTVTVVSGGSTAAQIEWGGTYVAAFGLDNGADLSGGCLRVSNPARAVDVTNCSPEHGVFTVPIPSDLDTDSQTTVTLTGADNTGDFSGSLSGWLAFGTTLGNPFGRLPSRGTASLTVNPFGITGAPLASGCVELYVWANDTGSARVGQRCAPGGPVTFTGLAPGSYSVGLVNVPGSFSEWWAPGGVSTRLFLAPRVTLTDGGTKSFDLTAPATQTISGKVIDAGGNPRSDGTVEFVVGGVPVASAQPAANGTYEITSPIVQGMLRLNGFGKAATQWQPNASIPVFARAFGGPGSVPVTNDANFVVSPSASFVGTFDLPDRFNTTTGCIRLMPDFGADGPLASWCGEVGDQFSLPALSGSDYLICVATSDATDACAGSTPSSEDVGWEYSDYTVPPGGGSVLVDVRFGGTYRVTPKSPNGDAVDGGCATFLSGSTVLATTCSRVSGAFEFSFGDDLQGPGTRKVLLTGFDGFGDASASMDAIYSGITQQKDVTLEPWAAITGAIDRPAGSESTTVCARIFGDGDFERESCVPPGNAQYSVAAPPGRYAVEFYAMEPGVAFEWYSNAATRNGATVVEHTWVDTTVNASLAIGGHLTGAVRGPTGSSGTGGCVEIYDGRGFYVDETCVDLSGHYEFTSLPAGTYKALFVRFGGLATTWYGGTNFGNATAITVKAGANPDINIALAYAATITGHVTYSGSAAVGGCVDLVDADGYTLSSDCPGPDGQYVISDAPPGWAHLLFRDFEGAANQWYGGASSFAAASALHLAGGLATTVDVSLGRGGSISGEVRDMFGAKPYDVALLTLGGAVVDTVSVMGDYSSSATFTFEHVPQGQYKLTATMQGSTYSTPLRKSGTYSPAFVAVPQGGNWDVAGLLWYADDDNGAISGRLNVPTSWKSSTVCALAVLASGTISAADCGPRGGEFSLTRLSRDGSYRIAFTNGEVRTTSQFKAFTGAKIYYGNTTSFSSAPTYYNPSVSSAYLPVWFYSDVTYKTANFEAIQWLGDYNFYRPSANTFRPDSTMTRRDLATYLYKVAGSPAVMLPSKSPFTDVPTTDGAYRPLLWLRATKVWTSTTFKPSAGLDKKTEALILYRVAGSPSVTLPSKNPYKDIKSSDSAYKAVTWANKYHIVSKSSSTTFGATSLVKRKYGAASLYAWWWRFG